MLTNELSLLLVEFALIYFLFFGIVGIGRLIEAIGGYLSPDVESGYSHLFYYFIAGLLSIIASYAIVITGGKTINILLVPLLLGLFKLAQGHRMAPEKRAFKTGYLFAEVAFISLLVLCVLHLFPVSEYKQADSFFYLKIAESLNATGQENISHYFNLYNSSFHGAEPYHYFEIWITAFIIRFTQSFLPSIYVEQYVTYGLLLTALVVGLYMLAEQFIKQKLGLWSKLFCWSLLFIFPNVLGYFPKLYHVFISDFEGNLVDRPNFRIIYLLLVPVVAQLFCYRKMMPTPLLFLLVLCVMSFQFLLVCIPGLIFYSIYLMVSKSAHYKIAWWPIAWFSGFFFLFYWLFSVRNIPSFFGTDASNLISQTVQKGFFIIYSIITSALYIVLLFLLLTLPLLLASRRSYIKYLQQVCIPVLPLVAIAICGLFMARILLLKDNAYQFLFVAHIIITLLTWLLYLKILSTKASSKYYFASAAYLSVFWLLHWVTRPGTPAQIFTRNDPTVYNGQTYSSAYVDSVLSYFSQVQPSEGAYLADSVFYSNVYYSRRNPNVYFLPITYRVAGVHNRNIEFCLSDTSALLTGVDHPVFEDYLDNAISRNLFYRWRLQHPRNGYTTQVKEFMSEQKIPYLVATKNVAVDLFNLSVAKRFVDPVTGERFLVLRY